MKKKIYINIKNYIYYLFVVTFISFFVYIFFNFKILKLIFILDKIFAKKKFLSKILSIEFSRNQNNS
jgi:hypothetical protein